MNDRDMRELLQEIIDDVDQGRVRVTRPRVLKTAGTVLAAAAALGIAACSGPAKRDARDPGDNRPAPAQVDAGTQAAEPDAAANNDPTPKPPDMQPPPPVPAYGVPVTQPRPPKRRPLDPGPQPEYGVP